MSETPVAVTDPEERPPGFGGLRILAGAVLGSLPGLILLLWNRNVGAAIAVAGSIVGTFVAGERIGFLRLMALSLFALGRVAAPLSKPALKATEKRGPHSETDWLANWATEGWRDGPLRARVVVGGLLVGATVGGALALHDFRSLQQGGQGLILPYRDSRASLPLQVFYLVYSWAGWTCGVASLFSSIAFQRPVILAAFAAAGFGVVISLSVGRFPAAAAEMVLHAIAGTLAVTLLIAFTGGPREDESPSDAAV